MSSLPPSAGLAPLIIAFEEQRCQVAPGDSFTFGRKADLVLDSENRLLHRVLGRFDAGDTGWRLHNEGRSTALVVTDLDSASYVRLVAGSAMPLPFRSASITFTAGRANYRLDTYTESVEPEAAGSNPVPAGDLADATLTTGALVFNDEQFALLRALAAPRLDGPITSADLPTNRELAHQLGWSITKFNRKLDNLCIKLDKVGVVGLTGSVAEVAVDRRLRLANFVVEQGIVAKD